MSPLMGFLGVAVIDLQQLKERTDLLAIAWKDTTLKKVASTGGGEWAGPCPFCGGKDRFRVQPYHEGGGLWLCRHCTDGKWQDSIAYVMRRDNLDFKAACEALGAHDLQPVRERQRPPESPAYSPTAGDWQIQVLEVIRICESNLWSPIGEKAFGYLLSRGLQEDFIKAFMLGFSPGFEHEGLKIHRGVTIPCVVRGEVWYLKIRTSPKDKLPKYINVKGSRSAAIFNAEFLFGEDQALFCEGEFDAMLATQEIGDLIPCVTLGAAKNLPDLATWGPYLFPLQRILVTYDSDQAGQEGADRLAELSSRVRSAPLPDEGFARKPKDINDFYLAGGDLRAWITPHLEATYEPA